MTGGRPPTGCGGPATPRATMRRATMRMEGAGRGAVRFTGALS